MSIDKVDVFPDVMPHNVADHHNSCGINCIHPENRNTSREGEGGSRYKDRRQQRTDESSVTEWGPQNVFQVMKQEAFVRFCFFDVSVVTRNLVYVLYKLAIGTYAVTISLGYDFWNLWNPVMVIAREFQ